MVPPIPVTFFQRISDGNTQFHPTADCRAALYVLTGSKLLTRSQLNALAALGCAVEEVKDPERLSLGFDASKVVLESQEATQANA